MHSPNPDKTVQAKTTAVATSVLLQFDKKPTSQLKWLNSNLRTVRACVVLHFLFLPRLHIPSTCFYVGTDVLHTSMHLEKNETRRNFATIWFRSFSLGYAQPHITKLFGGEEYWNGFRTLEKIKLSKLLTDDSVKHTEQRKTRTKYSTCRFWDEVRGFFEDMLRWWVFWMEHAQT